MPGPLVSGVPVELWDEIFDHILFYPYHSTVDLYSPFHVVYYLRRINSHDLYEYRALKRHRRRLLLVCKSWYIHISQRSNLWIYRVTQRSDGVIIVPNAPITTLDCENCSFKAIRLFSLIHGAHIRSLHIYLVYYSHRTCKLVEVAARHLPNLAVLSIHISVECKPVTLHDVSTQLTQLKALSLSRVGSNMNGDFLAGGNLHMPLLETLELTSDSYGIWRDPSRLSLPALNHIYGQATAFVGSRSFFGCIGHQIQSIGLYGELLVDQLTFDEFLQQLPNLKLLAADFRHLQITGDTPVVAGNLETLVHLGNAYIGFLTHPIVREFLGNVGRPDRKVRISDVWTPSGIVRYPDGGAKKHTLCYSQEQRDEMKCWAEEIKKAGVRLEDMKGLTYYEAERLSSLKQSNRQPPLLLNCPV